MRAFLYMNQVNKKELIELHRQAKLNGRTLNWMIANVPMSVRNFIKTIRG